VLPVVLASKPGSLVPFQVATVLLAGAVLLSLWASLRRRHARLALVPLVVLALVVVGTFLPTEADDVHGLVTGSLTGSARVPLALDPGAPLSVRGGTGSVAGTDLVLDCPSGCTFTLGRASFGAHASATADATGGNLAVALTGGPMSVTSQTWICHRVPLVLAWTAGGEACYVCDTATYATEATDAAGPTTLRASITTTCDA
jgi:hypothetical protein